LRHIVGEVIENSSEDRNGIFEARFPHYADNRPVEVIHTSPFYQPNAGGLVAIPEAGTQIICLANESPYPNENVIYYLASIPSIDGGSRVDEQNPNYENIRSNDPKAKIYGEDSKRPVTQTLTNTAGAGLYIHREFAQTKISNNVTMKSETDNEVNVGSVGVQIRNNEGDSIVLNGSEPNDQYSARSLAIETMASQEYKCTNSDIKMKVVDGGDINIVNDSTGAYSIDGKWYGNVRLKSRFRNIDLAALGSESYVNIFTQGATIQVDSQGTVKIFGQGSIQLESPQDISLNAGSNVNIYGGAGVQVGSGGTVSINGTSITHNSIPLQYSAGAPGSDYTNSTPVLPAAGSPPAGTQFVPNDYNDPTGAV
jgi:hypothetical protein